jgi:comEA protein
VAREEFETAKERREGEASWSHPYGLFVRYRPQIVVSIFIVVVLLGGAYYSSRFSGSAPKTVYQTSLDEAKTKAQTPLLVDLNTAGAKELDELPGVGPSTAQKIVEYRRQHGKFESVNDLEDVPGIGPQKLEKIKPFAKV